jgi:integrase
MPRVYEMSWEGPPAYRWVRMYRGVRYRVSCQELGAMVYTKEATGKVANEWWRKRRAELDGEGKPGSAAAHQRMVDAFAGRKVSDPVDYLSVADQLLASLPSLPVAVRDKVRTALLGLGEVERIQVEVGAAPRKQDQSRTVRAAAERFLAKEQGDLKPTSFRDLKNHILRLVERWGNQDVKVFEEATVEEYGVSLKRSGLDASTRKKAWGFFRRLVRYCWEAGLLPSLPRNLDSFDFAVRAKQIRTPAIAVLRDVLAGLSPRLRLYALLGLNCGMGSVDIGQLGKEQVDLNTGRIVRRRVKTGDKATVPTVEYQLWQETLTLLREQWSSHPTLALVNSRGGALWACRVEEDGRTPAIDLICDLWRTVQPPIPFQFRVMRRVAATLLESHPDHCRYVQHYLGHAPASVAQRHYAAPSQARFDEAIDWLRQQVIG